MKVMEGKVGCHFSDKVGEKAALCWLAGNSLSGPRESLPKKDTGHRFLAVLEVKSAEALLRKLADSASDRNA